MGGVHLMVHNFFFVFCGKLIKFGRITPLKMLISFGVYIKYRIITSSIQQSQLHFRIIIFENLFG